MKQYVRIEQCRREWLMITLVAQGTLRILPLTHMTAVISVQITVMYQSIPKPPIPPRAIPGHLTRVKLRTVGNLT